MLLKRKKKIGEGGRKGEKKKGMLHRDFSIHICAVVSRKQTRRTSFVVGYHGYVA